MLTLFRTTLIILALMICASGIGHANSFGVNLYGLSYHMNNRRGAGWLEPGTHFNEFNKGIGLRATFGTDSAATTLFVEGGTFRDSFRNQAKYLSLGFQVRLIYQLRMGINAAVYTTRSIHAGNPIFAPIPIMSYSVSIVTLNAVYLPKYKSYNPWNTLGAYLTIRLFSAKR